MRPSRLASARLGLALIRMDDLIGILAFIALGIGMAGVSGGLAEKAWGWFEGLEMPDWTPSAMTLRGAWAAAHVCLGAAGWIIWQSEAFVGAPLAFTLAASTLLGAVIWSAVVFRRRALRNGFFLMCVVWVLAALTSAAFAAEAPGAGVFSLPMTAVITLIGVLNFAAWQLNTSQLEGDTAET